MDRLVVACVQQRLHLPSTFDDHRSDLERFMRVAQTKGARLIVFPELAGLMVALPLLADVRSALLKRADLGARRRATTWQRLSGSAAGSLAAWLGVDLRTRVMALVDVEGPALWLRYADLFGGLARQFAITVVAPSAYLPDPSDGVVRNLAAVFGAGGELLGTQAKVLLHPEDESVCRPGTGWQVIQSDAGRIGLILGSDALYPEVGRLLAYQGAEVLVGQGACPDPALYNKIRAAVLARMQDNQLFALVSFLVGDNRISRRRTPYTGRSAIFAPQELTPRYSGVLVEMGNARSEGVLSAEWDFFALRQLWDDSDTPVRQKLPPAQVATALADLYARLLQQPADVGDHLLAEGDWSAPTETPIALDDLPVIATITSRWPPAADASDGEDDLSDEWMESVSTVRPPIGGQSSSAPKPRSSVAADDETDEMDVVPPL